MVGAVRSEARRRADKRYREAHREEILARRRAAHVANPEPKSASQKKYYAANREKRRAYEDAYWAARPGERKAKYARYRAANLEKVRTKQLTKYGMTQQCYETMAAAQDHACLICGAEAWMERNGVLHVDHDHATGKIRGLLCTRRNTGLGLFRDNPALMEEAILYLQKAASDA